MFHIAGEIYARNTLSAWGEAGWLSQLSDLDAPYDLLIPDIMGMGKPSKCNC